MCTCRLCVYGVCICLRSLVSGSSNVRGPILVSVARTGVLRSMLLGGSLCVRDEGVWLLQGACKRRRSDT